MTAATPVRPVAGERFKAAARLRPGGEKRRRVLALLAAFADGGQPSTDANELAERLDLPLRTVVELLRRLEADGYISPSRSTRRRRFPRYRVVLEEARS